MLDAMKRRDRQYDGRFVTGVVTTGIYCLPSCAARKPKDENVHFYRQPEEALAAGLRACRRCYPDRFYRSEDPDKRALEQVVARLLQDPSEGRTVADLARAVQVGTSKLNALVRRHYHVTPATLLGRLRVARACRLLVDTEQPVSDVAFEAGFGTLSAFGANVRRSTGLAPGGVRALRGASCFDLQLPRWLRIASLARYWSRDPTSLTEQVDGSVFRFGLRLGAAAIPARLDVEVEGRRARCHLTAAAASGRSRASAQRLGDGAAYEALSILIRLFGFAHDPRPFERRARAEVEMAALVDRQPGLIVPQTRDVFEGLIWVVAGQQVSLAAAFAMRHRLFARTGVDVGHGLVAPPVAEDVAELTVPELRAMGFSFRKAEVVLAAARDIADGVLATDTNFVTATTVEQSLLARAGFGPWSVGYLMMRTWGFADCVPVGDAALLRRLVEVYGLPERPDVPGTLALMQPFAPDRSLATFHLWQKPPED